MKVTYFKQKPSKKFKILDKINVIYSSVGEKPTFQIMPFKVNANGKEYTFDGLNSGAWNPIFSSALLAEIDENDNFYLTVITPDMLENAFDLFSDRLGIIMYLGKDEITVLDHREAA